MRIFACALVFLSASASFAGSAALGPSYSYSYKDVQLMDASRTRAIPLRIYHPGGSASPRPNLPAQESSPSPSSFPSRSSSLSSSGLAAFPVVIFSHGLGASNKSYAYFGESLASQGFIVIVPDHPGTDSAVLTPGKPLTSLRDLRKAAREPQQWIARAKGISFVIDHLKELAPDADASHIAVAGHSLGALTALLLAGAALDPKHGLKKEQLSDSRIQAFVAASPPGHEQGMDKQPWVAIDRPVLIVVGSKDRGLNGEPPSWRQESYDGLPTDGQKYFFLVDGATNLAFADETYGGVKSVQEKFTREALLFLKAMLLADTPSKAILETDTGVQHK